MSRLATSLAVLLAASAAPAMAADWADDFAPSDGFRGAYANEPKDWMGYGDTNDEVTFQTGMRYWYSWGAQNFETMGNSFKTDDNASTGEVFLRIDDQASRSYAKGLIGYSAAVTGSYSDPDNANGEISDGTIGYAGADFGWDAFGDGHGNGVGLFAGYQYWQDSPRTARTSFTTASSAADVSYDPDTGETFLPFDSADNLLEAHLLRLGFSGQAKFDMFDVSFEAAAVPYAKVSGILGGAGFDSEMNTDLGNYSFVKSSETQVDGWGYGAMGEVMVGVTPVENLTFRVGGRAWYLQGTVDSTYSALTLTDPSDSDPDNEPNYDIAPTVTNQRYIETANPFSMFRYGIVAEMTYSF